MLFILLENIEFHFSHRRGSTGYNLGLKKNQRKAKENNRIYFLLTLFIRWTVTIRVNSPPEGSKGMKDGRCQM